MLRTISLVAFLLLPIHAAAQTTALLVDLSTLGWGTIAAESIDTDGDDATREFLVEQIGPFQFNLGERTYRVVAVRGGLCLSDWFTVRTGPEKPLLKRVAGHAILEVQGRFAGAFANQPLINVTLETPACP